METLIYLRLWLLLFVLSWLIVAGLVNWMWLAIIVP